MRPGPSCRLAGSCSGSISSLPSTIAGQAATGVRTSTTAASRAITGLRRRNGRPSSTCRSPGAQLTSTQDSRLESVGGGIGRAPELQRHTQCCDDQLNLGNTCPFGTPSASPRRASSRPSAAAAIRTITLWPRPSSVSSRPRSSAERDGLP
jgi:hypothetical protein